MVITSSTKTSTFNKSLFLRKSPVKASDVKETQCLSNDIPQVIASHTNICSLDSGMRENGLVTHIAPTPQLEQVTIVNSIIPKAAEQEKTHTPIAQESWNKEDQELINWVLAYINSRTVTRDAYKKFEQEIALGPNSPRAKTRELQEGFLLMKRLIEGDKI